MSFLKENENEIIRNIKDPDDFIPDSFDAQNIGMDIMLIVGRLKRPDLIQAQMNPERLHVQGVKFKKPTWDMENALAWLQENMKNFTTDPEETKSNFKKTYQIKGVEIFSVGTWNNQTFTEKDLDKMVESFNKTKDGVRPFLKLGHDEQQKLLQAEGLPAAGWVDSIYRDGQKLKADFVDIPKKIFELIQRKAYRKVSIELFKGVEILKQKFDFLISAVALLGAEVPGVMNLQDILATYKISNYDNVETFTNEFELKFKTNEKSKPQGGTMTLEEKLAKAELEAKQAKEQLEKFQADADKFKSDADALKTEKEQMEKELSDAKEKFAKTAAELKQIELDKNVAELEAKGLITKAMVPFAKQLLDADRAEFTIEKDKKEQTATRFELVQHLFTLAKGSDVNFDDNSLDDKPETRGMDFDKIDAEIQKFAKENNVSYSEAYTAVTHKYEKELEPVKL